MNEEILENLQAINSRNGGNHSIDFGANCRKFLDIGFFFDGISRNLTDDVLTGKVSNIAAMFESHLREQDDKLSNSFRKHYYSGLGTSFDSSLSDDVVGAANRVPSETVGTGEGQLRTSATDAAKEVLSDGGSGRWYEVFGRSFKVSITQPWNWVKAARDATIRTGMEAVAPIRDSSLAANLLMSGSHTRLSSAIGDFRQSVSDVKQNSELHLSRIRVSVFGFDFGAAIAKAFVQQLLDEVCEREGERFVYQGSDVEVVFVGLLDCVDRTHPEMGPIDWFHPLTPVLDDGGKLHPACQRALHLIAAHERRFYRRCRPLGGQNSQWHEELCPGISEDIGGGLKADEQKASAELSRAVLHRMYRRATIAGVPFPPLDTLREQNEFTAQMFELNDEIEGYSLPVLARHYQRLTNSRQTPTDENFRSHTLVYLAWLAQRYRDYQDTLAALEAREDALPNRYYHRTIGSLVASVSGDQEEWSLQAAERAEIDAALSKLKQAWGWLEDVDSEAQDIRRRERSSDRNTYLHARTTLRHHSQLANSWYQWTREESPPELPEPVGLLFAYGLHDKQPEEMTYRNRQPSQLVGGYRFMTWRGIDEPEEASSVTTESTEAHPREAMDGWAMR